VRFVGAPQALGRPVALNARRPALGRGWSIVAALMLCVATSCGGAAPATSATATKPAPAPAKPIATPPAVALVDINTASREQLERLPSIGVAIAPRIIRGRPYKTKRELLTRKILGASAYAKVSPLIIARQ